MAMQDKGSKENEGLLGYVISWVVGLGIFSLLICAALFMIQE